MSIIDTGLPDGTEDFVGSKAKELENLRSSLLDKFYKDGCELVIPSLIEFTESIGGIANNSLKDYTYSFSDETAKDISIRPDISQQIARIDIQDGAKNKKKYCYFGETLRKTKDSLTKSRIAYKTGVELFGNINSSDEIEIINDVVLDDNEKKNENEEQDEVDDTEEDEDGGFGLGDWLEMAETAEVVEQEDGNYEYFDDLSISSSWTGKSPKELLKYLTRKSRKTLKYIQEETNSIKFGGGFLYSLHLPKNLHKNKNFKNTKNNKKIHNFTTKATPR